MLCEIHSATQQTNNGALLQRQNTTCMCSTCTCSGSWPSRGLPKETADTSRGLSGRHDEIDAAWVCCTLLHLVIIFVLEAVSMALPRAAVVILNMSDNFPSHRSNKQRSNSTFYHASIQKFTQTLLSGVDVSNCV